jgi:hypothetical protein
MQKTALARRRLTKTDETLWTNKTLAERYGKTVRTVTRWRADPRMNFPPPDLEIYRRDYWRPATIEKWEEERAQASDT